MIQLRYRVAGGSVWHYANGDYTYRVGDDDGLIDAPNITVGGSVPSPVPAQVQVGSITDGGYFRAIFTS